MDVFHRIPRVPEIESGELVRRGGRVVTTTVNMNLREFAENSTDFQHFEPLHGQMCLPFSLLPIPGITINHDADWKRGEEGWDHIAYFINLASLSFLNHEIQGSSAKAVITYVGPGGLVFFTFTTPLGKIVLFQTHTPVDEMRLKVQFMWYASVNYPTMLVEYIVGNWIGFIFLISFHLDISVLF